MRSLVRAKKYPSTALGAHYFLGAVLKYLEFETRRVDIYRLLGVCEADSIVRTAREQILTKASKVQQEKDGHI